jgi:hypothetical protein
MRIGEGLLPGRGIILISEWDIFGYFCRIGGDVRKVKMGFPSHYPLLECGNPTNAG